MPLYTVMTQDGLLSAQQRDVIAAELVRIHTTAMSVPANFVHSIFPTYPRNHAYVAADRTPVASIVGVIRAPEEKPQLVQALPRSAGLRRFAPNQRFGKLRDGG